MSTTEKWERSDPRAYMEHEYDFPKFRDWLVPDARDLVGQESMIHNVATTLCDSHEWGYDDGEQEVHERSQADDDMIRAMVEEKLATAYQYLEKAAYQLGAAQGMEDKWNYRRTCGQREDEDQSEWRTFGTKAFEKRRQMA